MVTKKRLGTPPAMKDHPILEAPSWKRRDEFLAAVGDYGRGVEGASPKIPVTSRRGICGHIPPNYTQITLLTISEPLKVVISFPKREPDRDSGPAVHR